MNRWDPKDRERWVRAMMIVFGGWVVAGVVAVTQADGTTYYYGSSGGGTAIDAGSYVASPGSCAPGYLPVAQDDGGQIYCNPYVTVDVSGNITLSVGGTIDGRDPSVDGIKLDSITSPVERSSVLPAAATDAGGTANATWGVPAVLRGTGGATYTNDAGYMMPGGLCSVAVPINQTARFVIQWIGTHFGQWDAGGIPSGYCTVRRSYTARNTNGTLSTPNVVLAETDQPSGTTCTGGVAFDGGVFQPWPQGPSATLVRWECSILELTYTANP